MNLPTRGKRLRVARRMPSLNFHSGMSAGSLFASDGGRAAAMKRGTEIHAAYEQIEWIDPADAKTDVERALVKPEGIIDLWRERSYELFREGVWESGQFDRVVFTGEGVERRATIYDFKTNEPRTDETADAFAARMRATYSGQMSSYRHAIHELTGIPLNRISSALLLLATGRVVKLDVIGQ